MSEYSSWGGSEFARADAQVHAAFSIVSITALFLFAFHKYFGSARHDGADAAYLKRRG